MTKYNETFKMRVVKDYQEGKLGYKLLAKKYGVKSHKQMIHWVKNYKTFGIEGLRSRKRLNTYSMTFKLTVLNFMKRTGASMNETALEFGLTNPPMIATWKKTFLEGGSRCLKQTERTAAYV